jgi:hypothetical protein
LLLVELNGGILNSLLPLGVPVIFNFVVSFSIREREVLRCAGSQYVVFASQKIGLNIFGESSSEEQVWKNTGEGSIDVGVTFARAYFVQQMSVGLVHIKAVGVILFYVYKVEGFLGGLALGSGPGDFAVCDVEALLLVVGVTVFIFTVNVGVVELFAEVVEVIKGAFGFGTCVVEDVHGEGGVVEKVIVVDHLLVDISKLLCEHIVLLAYSVIRVPMGFFSVTMPSK